MFQKDECKKEGYYMKFQVGNKSSKNQEVGKFYVGEVSFYFH